MDPAGQRHFSGFRNYPAGGSVVLLLKSYNQHLSIMWQVTVSVTGSDSHWLYVSLQFINVSFGI